MSKDMIRIEVKVEQDYVVEFKEGTKEIARIVPQSECLEGCLPISIYMHSDGREAYLGEIYHEEDFMNVVGPENIMNQMYETLSDDDHSHFAWLMSANNYEYTINRQKFTVEGIERYLDTEKKADEIELIERVGVNPIYKYNDRYYVGLGSSDLVGCEDTLMFSNLELARDNAFEINKSSLVIDESDDLIETFKNVKVGDSFVVDENLCEDEHILEWLETQDSNVFVISRIELEAFGVWIDGCDFRFDLNEIIIQGNNSYQVGDLAEESTSACDRKGTCGGSGIACDECSFN